MSFQWESLLESLEIGENKPFSWFKLCLVSECHCNTAVKPCYCHVVGLGAKQNKIKVSLVVSVML